jgi:hypothetical protein
MSNFTPSEDHASIRRSHAWASTFVALAEEMARRHDAIAQLALVEPLPIFRTLDKEAASITPEKIERSLRQKIGLIGSPLERRMTNEERRFDVLSVRFSQERYHKGVLLGMAFGRQLGAAGRIAEFWDKYELAGGMGLLCTGVAALMTGTLWMGGLVGFAMPTVTLGGVTMAGIALPLISRSVEQGFWVRDRRAVRLSNLRALIEELDAAGLSPRLRVEARYGTIYVTLVGEFTPQFERTLRAGF